MIENILAVGAGTMGSQASFYYAMNGCNVTQFDVSEAALEACKGHHHDYIAAFRSARPEFPDEEIAAGLARIHYSSNLESAAEGADLVTESVPEVFELKQRLYVDLNRVCPEHTIFTTNTSTLLPSAIAPLTGRPERFLALHYAIGVWDSPLAEIMPHPGTDAVVFDQVVRFVDGVGLIPIKIEQEQQGYIINSLLLPLLNAALSLVVNGVSSHQDVDRTWLICNKGTPLGPNWGTGSGGIRSVSQCPAPAGSRGTGQSPAPEEHRLPGRTLLSKGFTSALSGRGFYSYPNPEYLEPGFLKASG